MTGGVREGGLAIRGQKEKHGVREGVEGEVGPIFRGWSWLQPWEGKAAARVPRTQCPKVR